MKERRAAKSDAPRTESILALLAFAVFVVAAFLGVPHVLGMLYLSGVVS